MAFPNDALYAEAQRSRSCDEVAGKTLGHLSIEYFLLCLLLEKHGHAYPNEAEKYDRVGWYLKVEVRETVSEYRQHRSGTGEQNTLSLGRF